MPAAAQRTTKIGTRRTTRTLVALTVTLATFMEVLDSSIANVSLPHIAGSLGATYEEATWMLTSYLVSSRHRPAGLRLALHRHRTQALLHDLRAAVHRLLVPVRHCAQPSGADRRAHPARRGRRRPAALRAGHPGRHVLHRKTRHGLRALRHGRGGGARHRPDAGRLDHRQFQLALDLLHQPADRRCCRCSSPSRLVEDPPWIKRRKRSGITIDYIGLALHRHRRGLLPGGARQGPGRRLVRLLADPRHVQYRRSDAARASSSGSGITRIRLSTCACSRTATSAPPCSSRSLSAWCCSDPPC